MSDRRLREVLVLAAVAVGGGVGGAGRWLVGQVLPPEAGTFPWATFVENVTGCLLIGVVMAVLVHQARGPAAHYARPFLVVGVLGGYTTFSAYAAEATGLVRAGSSVLAAVYVVASVVAGLVCAWAGLASTERLVARRRRAP